jgi:uncharacterized protein with NAD-binding domain and iron-sulfur cluster
MIGQRHHVSKRKVAILGAGPAGLSAALALSRTREQRALYDVTIYQSGWRAGGKCATGRAMDKGWRVEQNGSHYLFGCYGNSFEIVQEAYEVLSEHGVSDFGDYRGQFVPRNLIVAQKDRGKNRWESWFLHLPETTGWPDRGKKYPPFSHFFFMFVQVLLGGLLGLFINSAARGDRAAGVMIRLFPISPFNQGLYARCARACALAVAWVIDVPLGLPFRGLWRVARFLWRMGPPGSRELLRSFVMRSAKGGIGWFRARARQCDPTLWGDGLERFGLARRLHRLRILVELGTTIVLGTLGDRLWEAGRLEAIDGLDFRDWLKGHGARPDAAESPFVKTWYDAVVAYEDGVETKPGISAAVTVYALFRAVATYKGAFAFQMRHEIGDSFIGPICKALELRGVTFEFFHRVRDVIPGTADRGHFIERIELEEQLPASRRRHHRRFVTMQPTGGEHGESPELRKVWPSRPVFDDDTLAYESEKAIPPGLPFDSFFRPDSGLRRWLTRGTDFDDVVFALPVGVVHTLPGLRDRPSWSDAHRHVQSIATQSLRLWFRDDLKKLGWRAPPPILSAFASPLSTWEDNGQNRGCECFGGYGTGEEPNAIATLFGPLAHGNVVGMTAAQAHALQLATEAGAFAFYQEHAPCLWPKLELFKSLLAGRGDEGIKRFEWQYRFANVGPVEAYILALPGTLRHRIRPDETGFQNMSAAGEWTRNGFEVGCVEGAVLSGLIAARAIAHDHTRAIGEEDLTFAPFASRGPALRRPRYVRPPERLSA